MEAKSDAMTIPRVGLQWDKYTNRLPRWRGFADDNVLTSLTGGLFPCERRPTLYRKGMYSQPAKSTMTNISANHATSYFFSEGGCEWRTPPPWVTSLIDIGYRWGGDFQAQRKIALVSMPCDSAAAGLIGLRAAVEEDEEELARVLRERELERKRRQGG